MNFYLIHPRRVAVILYTEIEQTTLKASPDPLSDSPDLVDRLIARLSVKQGRPARFLKNLIVLVRDTYYKLENKIDPMERVFKRLRHASRFNLFYSARFDKSKAIEEFENLLVRQRNKHTFWICVDSLISLCAILLSPVLIPLPGPNVFLYYPGLRTLSHYLARRGTLHGLRLMERSLFPSTLISELEPLLNQERSHFDWAKVRALAQELKLEHLALFLERYS